MTTRELTPKDFCVKWDEERAFTFTESEDATIITHGHRDREDLIEEVFLYDTLADSDNAERHSGPEVRHVWATQTENSDPDGAGWYLTWGGVLENTPGAFPVTVILR